MDVPGIAFAIPLIVVPILFLPLAYRSKGESRLFGFVCATAAIALGIVKILMYTGRMDGEGPVYWTLNISLSALFFVTLLLGMYWARKRHKTAAS
jgi:hypothetical protein